MGIPLAENPPELYAPGKNGDARLDDVQGLWCVVHTKPRCEKKLAEWLHAQNLPYYLPLTANRSNSGNVYLNPLFPGILFLAGQSAEQQNTGGLSSGFIPGTNPPQRITPGVPQGPLPDSQQLLNEACNQARESNYVFGYLFARDQVRLRQELRILASETATSRTLRREEQDFPPGRRVAVSDPAHPLYQLPGLIALYDDSGLPSDRVRVAVQFHLLNETHSLLVPRSALAGVSGQ